MTPEDPRHGTPAGWCAHYADNDLPACEPCRRSANRYNQRLRLDHLHGVRRRVPVLGVHRRLQALACLGWPAMEVAHRLGISQQALAESTAPDRREVTRRRFDAIAEIYDALSGTIGPSPRTAKIARNRGWAPPLAWDDIDDPAERPQGHRVCTMDGCAGEHLALGLCRRHYHRSRRTG